MPGRGSASDVGLTQAWSPLGSKVQWSNFRHAVCMGRGRVALGIEPPDFDPSARKPLRNRLRDGGHVPGPIGMAYLAACLVVAFLTLASDAAWYIALAIATLPVSLLGVTYAAIFAAILLGPAADFFVGEIAFAGVWLVAAYANYRLWRAIAAGARRVSARRG